MSSMATLMPSLGAQQHVQYRSLVQSTVVFLRQSGVKEKIWTPGKKISSHFGRIDMDETSFEM